MGTTARMSATFDLLAGCGSLLASCASRRGRVPAVSWRTSRQSVIGVCPQICGMIFLTAVLIPGEDVGRRGVRRRQAV